MQTGMFEECWFPSHKYKSSHNHQTFLLTFCKVHTFRPDLNSMKCLARKRGLQMILVQMLRWIGSAYTGSSHSQHRLTSVSLSSNKSFGVSFDRKGVADYTRLWMYMPVMYVPHNKNIARGTCHICFLLSQYEIHFILRPEDDIFRIFDWIQVL